MVKLLDCTIRDGGHINNWCFEKDFVYKLLKYLNEQSIDFCEIGYRNHFERENKGDFYYCSPSFLEEFYHCKVNLQLGIMTDVSRFAISDFIDAENDFIDFVRIAVHPERIKEALSISYELHNRGYSVFLQLMEIPNVKESHYKILENWKHKEILKSLYIADTYSTVLPQDLPLYFNKLNSLGYMNISFHAHNKINKALQNTLEAINQGAYSVDISQNKIGSNLNYDLLLPHIS